MRLKKALILSLVLTFVTATVSVFCISAGADGKNESIGKYENAVTVDLARGTDKLSVIDAASARIRGGATPEDTDYFSSRSLNGCFNGGFYTINEATLGKCFNVDADGADSDYDGVLLTAWDDTQDITQRFRLSMNQDGSYTIYAACSRGGYNRVIAYDPVTEKVALYSLASGKQSSFLLKNAGEGTKYIVLADDETKYLALPEIHFNGFEVWLTDFADDGFLYEWRINDVGNSAGDSGEIALYPGKIMLITQGPFDIYSHFTQNAIDMQVNEGDSIVAPFTCRVAAMKPESGNCVWIESAYEVLYADGTYDYMTCMFMHDNDISDLSVGEIILQGEPFYEMGTAGYAEGEHCHISCYRGKYRPDMTIENDGPDAVNAWQAFFIPQGIEIRNDYGYPWVFAPGTEEE